MTVCGSDFLVAFDVYAVMTIIDVNMLENNTEILLKVNSVVENLPSTKKSWQHHCYICSKIFPTEFGLPLMKMSLSTEMVHFRRISAH